MEVIKYPRKDEWEKLVKRPSAGKSGLKKTTRKILKSVKENGDKAVKRFTREFDNVKLKELAVSEQEINLAEIFINEQLRAAILQAKKNIEAFHRPQQEEIKKIETMPGVMCWRRSIPIEKIGLYVPGGSAPLFSTVLMLGIPANIAGCKEIVLCTPSQKNGTISPAILYAAQLCGIKKIFRIGGVQAIAAMAYGTEEVPAVFKIFGPGNQYVTIAKQLVQQDGIAIDMPAGPSEVLVIADSSAIPDFVAADLLSQAEHGPDSQVILVTTDESLANKVTNAIEEQLKKLSRRKIIELALENSKLIITRSLDEAVAFSNLYAPEHLILSVADKDSLAERIINAGSVFIGNYSPESAGDYASGTNHVLPTNGSAASYSGVSLDSFMKKITYQQLTPDGLRNIGNTVMEMAAAEGLDAHKNAVAIRLKN
jgi:histidinol dehydrogenase